MKKIVFVLLLLASTFGVNYAQTVSGTVTDAADGQPLPGVNVSVQGTSNGAMTNIDGTYSIEVGNGSTLVFSFIGYATQSVAINGQTTINVVLATDDQVIEDVVITALGIEKPASGVTYSTQKVDGEELTRAKDVNLINSMAGKSAGVVITRGASGLGGSSKVVLRGNKSIAGNNQVLYVIDGIPMNNANGTQSGDLYSAYDGGDAISNLNPEDIESINVLKGASASALYGSQAANGVILITTKKGKNGVSDISFSSTTTFESPLALPLVQTEYGKTTPTGYENWGTKTSGLNANHLEDFFQTGITSINNISITSGNEKNQFYTSYANTSGKGITPGNELFKHNLTLRGTSQVTERLRIDVSANILSQKVNKRPYGGYYFNPLVGVYLFPVGDDFAQYEEFEKFDASRNFNVQNWDYSMDQGGLSFQNPYWVAERNPSYAIRNRLLSTFSAKYDIAKGIYAMARLNYDKTTDEFEQHIYASTDQVISHANGEYTMYNYGTSQIYADVLLVGSKELSESLTIDATLGFSTTSNSDKGFRASSFTNDLDGSTHKFGLYYANLFSLGNINGTSDFAKRDYKVEAFSQAVFGNLQFGIKKMLFIDFSGRNEWSSTVNKTFFYPQVGASFIVTQAITPTDAFTYGKVRLSYAQVGNALPFGYSNANPPYGILPGGSPIGAQAKPMPETDLLPERTSSFEIGLEARFLSSNLFVDATYYNTTTEDQVFRIAAPAGESETPYYYVNGGNIKNSGIELSLGYNFMTASGLKWTPSINFSTNKNEVIELSDKLDQPFVTVTSMDQSKIYELRIVEGGSYGDMYGYKFQRDANGNILKDGTTGDPLRTEAVELMGNANPDFLLSMNNTFSFKGLNLSFLLDGRFGGDVVSVTESYLDERGLSQRTADARNGSFVVDGTSFDPETYFKAVGGSAGIGEAYVYNATNIRLRELSLGYSFGSKFFGGAIKGLDLSLVGRNLFFLYKDAPFDPELTLSSGNGLQGLEAFSMPSTRTLGFNLKVKF